MVNRRGQEVIARGGLIVGVVVAGADASMAPAAVAAVGFAIGDRVVAAIQITNAVASADVTASFEATITVVDQIQQAITDLSADTHILVLVQRAEVGVAHNRVRAAIIAGVDASMAVQAIALAGAAIGDRVLSVLRITSAQTVADVSASFEGVVSVAAQIQQIATDLSAAASATLLIVTQRGNFSWPQRNGEYIARGAFRMDVCTAGNGAGARAVAPVNTQVGDTRIAVVRKENGQASDSQAASFEAAITVSGEIQQTATNLTGHEMLVAAQAAR